MVSSSPAWRGGCRRPRYFARCRQGIVIGPRGTERFNIAAWIKEKLWTSRPNRRDKTPLSSRTNHLLGGKAPSTYLASLEKSYGHTADRVDEILRTHQLEPGLLRSDAFHEFIQVRATRLLNLIEDAMGKAVSGRDSAEVISAFGAPLSSTG